MTELICITCPVGCKLEAELNGNDLTVTGHACKKGIDFARTELTNPTRTLCSTVRTNDPDSPMLPVRTSGEIPKEAMMDVMRLLAGVEVTKSVKCGDKITSLKPICKGHVIATCDWPFN